MAQIGAALLLADAIVRRSGIDDQRVAALQRVGDGDRRGGAGVGDDEAGAAVHALHRFGDQFLGLGAVEGIELELLAHEATGGVVVHNTELGTGEAIIGVGQVEQRQRRRFVRGQLARHDDADCLHGGRVAGRSLRRGRSWGWRLSGRLGEARLCRAGEHAREHPAPRPAQPRDRRHAVATGKRGLPAADGSLRAHVFCLRQVRFFL